MRKADVMPFDGGWKVVCKEDAEVLHELFIYSFMCLGVDLSFRVALQRAEIWVACGVALAFPVGGVGEQVSAGVVQ